MGFFDEYDYDEINTAYGLVEGKQRSLEVTDIKIIANDDGTGRRIVYTVRDRDLDQTETLLFGFLPGPDQTDENNTKSIKNIKRRLESFSIPEVQARTFGPDTLDVIKGIEFLADVVKVPQKNNPEYKNTFLNNIKRSDVVTSAEAATEFNWG